MSLNPLVRRCLPVVLVAALLSGLTLIAQAHPGHDDHDHPPASSESPAAPAETLVAGRLARHEVLAISLTVFVLAVFVGFEVIAKVPPTLHTPLMSGSNAISGITVVGAIIAAGNAKFSFATLLGFIAVVLAMINVVGGFVVTDRMLRMFKRR